MDNLRKVAKEVHMKYYSQGKFGKEREEIEEICELTGASKKDAKKAIYDIMHPRGMHPRGKFKSVAEKKSKEQRLEEKKKMKETKQNRKEAWYQFCETYSTKGENIVCCPKCKSTSIGYCNRPSVGKGVIGGLLGGEAGGPRGEALGIMLGGLSGGDVYAVCMNCGRQWKI